MKILNKHDFWQNIKCECRDQGRLILGGNSLINIAVYAPTVNKNCNNSNERIEIGETVSLWKNII